jgi:hypothetical protein
VTGQLNPGPAADRDPLADLERLLAAQVSGCEHLVAATELVRHAFGLRPWPLGPMARAA